MHFLAINYCDNSGGWSVAPIRSVWHALERRNARRGRSEPTPAFLTSFPVPSTVILNMSLVGAHAGRSSFTLPSVAAKDLRLPPLPIIQSKQHLQQVFTHSSSVGVKDSFQAPNGDAGADNEE
jgi:hypothetical protein